MILYTETIKEFYWRLTNPNLAWESLDVPEASNFIGAWSLDPVVDLNILKGQPLAKDLNQEFASKS